MAFHSSVAADAFGGRPGQGVGQDRMAGTGDKGGGQPSLSSSARGQCCNHLMKWRNSSNSRQGLFQLSEGKQLEHPGGSTSLKQMSLKRCKPHVSAPQWPLQSLGAGCACPCARWANHHLAQNPDLLITEQPRSRLKNLLGRSRRDSA